MQSWILRCVAAVVTKQSAEPVAALDVASGVLPIDGVEYLVQTGDVVIVAAGEDHHTRSSEDDPLVAAWYVMDR